MYFKKSFVSMFLVLLFLTCFIFLNQSIVAKASSTGVVNVRTSANVRSGPGLSNSVIGRLYNGNKVEVIKKSGSWYNIRMSNGTVGWIYSSLLNVTDSSTSSRSISGTYGVVTGSVVRVRSGAGVKGTTVLGNLSRGTKVEILGKKNTSDIYGLWYQIKAPNGLTGWFCGDYLKVTGSTPSQDSESNSNSETGYVTAGILNVRKVPTTKGNSPIGKLSKGSKVNIIGQQNGWYKIKWGSSQAWVSADYITKNSSSNDQAQSGTGYVNTRAGLNLRSLPVISSSTYLTTLPYKTQVSIKAQNGEWYKVELSDGKTGWVFSKYITKGQTSSRGGSSGSSSATASKVVATARKYLGYKYAYGGASPSTGFDCSGLTYYVFKQFGISLPRSSKAQSTYKATKISSIDKLEPGDLVFFTTNGSGTISHVGIYTGNGKFIHAPNSSRPVEEINMNTKFSGYYAKRFKWGLRVLN